MRNTLELAMPVDFIASLLFEEVRDRLLCIGSRKTFHNHLEAALSRMGQTDRHKGIPGGVWHEKQRKTKDELSSRTEE